MSCKIFFVLIIVLNGFFAYALSIFEPKIECTVIKVHKTVSIFGFLKFPTIYQSINNEPVESKLTIGGKVIPNVKPTVISHFSDTEIIKIENGIQSLELVIKGMPISRQGSLKSSGELIADITCH